MVTIKLGKCCREWLVSSTKPLYSVLNWLIESCKVDFYAIKCQKIFEAAICTPYISHEGIGRIEIDDWGGEVIEEEMRK